MSDNLEEFCQQHGLDFLSLSGTRPYTNGQCDIYRAIGGGRIDSIHLESYGRFGNNFFQMINAIWFARKTGIKRIFLPDMRTPFPQGTGVKFDDIEFVFDKMSFSTDSAALSGKFFFWWGLGGFLAKKSPKDTVQIIEKYLKPILLPQDVRTECLLASEILHIHIRSGDIFSPTTKVNSDYVQPPLAYYQKIIEHMISSASAHHVAVVFEDRNNPCVNALETWLNHNAIPNSFLSGTFFEDFFRLLGASHIVAGFGTFVPAIALLSSNLKSIYFFRDSQQTPHLLERGININLVLDAHGSYIKKGAWTNSPGDRELMLSYGSNSLNLRTNCT